MLFYAKIVKINQLFKVFVAWLVVLLWKPMWKCSVLRKCYLLTVN